MTPLWFFEWECSNFGLMVVSSAAVQRVRCSEVFKYFIWWRIGLFFCWCVDIFVIKRPALECYGTCSYANKFWLTIAEVCWCREPLMFYCVVLVLVLFHLQHVLVLEAGFICNLETYGQKFVIFQPGKVWKFFLVCWYGKRLFSRLDLLTYIFIIFYSRLI